MIATLKSIFWRRVLKNSKITFNRSALITFLRCQNLFWIENVRDGRQNQKSWNVNTAIQNKVREILSQLFPEAEKIESGIAFEDAVKKTAELLGKRIPILQPVITFEKIYIKPYALIPAEKDSWDLYTLFFLSQVKKDQIRDMAFYCFTAENSGIRIRDSYSITINKDYYFSGGSISPKEYFMIQKHTNEVQHCSPQIGKFILKMNKVSKNQSFPGTSGCSGVKQCEYKDTCFPNMKSGDIFELREGHHLAKNLYDLGIQNIAEIPETVELSEKQLIQKNAVLRKEPYFNQVKIQDFIKKVKYPIYYLDFETINPILPYYENTTPFQHVPVIYSLLIEKEDAKLEYHYYINDGKEDSQKEILADLFRLINPIGSVIVYDDIIEKKCLKNAVLLHPEYKEWLKNVLEHMVDISIIYKKFYYYHPKQKGSASLKNVVYASTGLQYTNMEIKNGGEANLEFLKILHSNISEDKKMEVSENLRNYSRQDVYALHYIMEVLKKVI